ncbi:hypothetical protein AGMMS4956_09170 [Bacteroidia bacterium]|nr:hypothetical protein AGMMS4956_09170 [Bacteroidia bacterium]
MKNIFFIALCVCSLTAKAQYEITVNIDGLRDSAIYLGYYFEDKRYVIDSAKIDKKGKAVFKSKEAIDKGVYFIGLPKRTAIDFLMTHEPKFSIVAARPYSLDKLQFKNSPDNVQFLDYQRFLQKQQRKMQMLRQQKTNNEKGAKDSVDIYNAQIKNIDETTKKYIHSLMSNNKGSFLQHILSVLQALEFPDFVMDTNIANQDSVLQRHRLQYICKHYFDPINFAEDGLIRTPFFAARIDDFFKNIISPAPDTVIKYVDVVLNKAKPNKEMFRYLTEHFFVYYQKSPIMSHDAVIMHIVDNYYLNGVADWTTAERLQVIKVQADRLRPTLLLQKAPDLLLQTLDGKFISLHEVNAAYTILFFFEPDCLHCQKEAPKLWETYQKFRDKNVEVWAVYADYNRAEWNRFVNIDHHYNWLNLWDGVEGKSLSTGADTTYSLGSNFRYLYNVDSTPLIFLLDKDKRIVAKRISIETLEKILDERTKIAP